MKFGSIDFLSSSVPENHLNITGGMSPTFLIVWFLIALWTFADPGFHQRSYAAKNGNIAKWGIIISIFFWSLFDFLTTTTGLFAKGVLPQLDNPVLAFPLFAEQVLPVGVKGIFYAALFATILSTQISFLFLSGTTVGRDFIFRVGRNINESKIKSYTIIGLIISGVIAILLAYFIPSVIEIWYMIGSLFIPGIILPVVSAYYPKVRVDKKFILVEMIAAFLTSTAWYYLRNEFVNTSFLNEIEPMLIGLSFALLIHLVGVLNRKAGRLV
jgi:SSS family solute:Na+ symporter